MNMTPEQHEEFVSKKQTEILGAMLDVGISIQDTAKAFELIAPLRPQVHALLDHGDDGIHALMALALVIKGLLEKIKIEQ